MYFKYFILTTLLLSSTVLSQSNEKIVDKHLILDSMNTNGNNIIKNRHSLALDLGPTLFTVGYLNLANLFVKQPDGLEKRILSSTFGIGINYHYLLTDKIQFEGNLAFNTALFYIYEGYRPPSPTIDFGVLGPGEVDKYFLTRFIDIPISFGVRFYLRKNKKNSGLFITPKIGGNIIVSLEKVETMRMSVVNPETGRTDFLYKVATNRSILNAGLFVSAELGMRIDVNIGGLNNKGIMPFVDISFIDLGYYILPYYSKNYIFGEAQVIADTLGKYLPIANIRIVPLPKIAFGVSF